MPRVIAIVPTFHPDESVVGRLERIAAQADQLIVVDDGSGETAGAVLAALRDRGCTVVQTPENRGIAAALNTGVRLALAQGAEYIATFDQDTVVPPEYLSVCLSIFSLATRATRLGVVASDRVNGHPAIPARHSPEGFGLVGEAIQSGMVISAECLQTCGLFEERYFIDCVDTEFCARIVQMGFRITIALGTNLQHELGRQVPRRPFGRSLVENGEVITYQYHSPYRRYFIARNNIDMCLRFIRSNPRWVIAVARREVPTGLDIVISGPDRMRQGLALLVGTVHGFLRRLGPMPTRLKRLLVR